eukprot:544692_1
MSLLKLVLLVIATEPTVTKSSEIKPLPTSTYSSDEIYLEWTSLTDINTHIFNKTVSTDPKNYNMIQIENISPKHSNEEFNYNVYSGRINNLEPGISYQVRIRTDIFKNQPPEKGEWSQTLLITTLTLSQSRKIWNMLKKSNIPYYTLGAVTAVGVTSVAMPLMGFTAGGVVAGSLAASIQAIIGPAGIGLVVFGVFQSVGAAGFGTATQAYIAAAGAGITSLLFGNTAISDHHEMIKAWFMDKMHLHDHNMVYYELFIENGFDSIDLIKEMNKDDLNDIGITKRGHIKQILKQITGLNDYVDEFCNTYPKNTCCDL